MVEALGVAMMSNWLMCLKKKNTNINVAFHYTNNNLAYYLIGKNPFSTLESMKYFILITPKVKLNSELSQIRIDILNKQLLVKSYTNIVI